MVGVGQTTHSGAPGVDIPVHVALRTTDVDQARAFCRRLFYGPLQVNRSATSTLSPSAATW
jgi:hypothetical protein